MATATRITPPIPPPFLLQLTLTEGEAKTLYGLLQFIGGSPLGARGHLNDITEALRRAGITHEFDSSAQQDGSGARGQGSWYLEAPRP